MDRIPFVATAYSCPHRFGLTAAQDGTWYKNPVTIEEWMDEAVELGLSGIEVPLTKDQCEPGALDRIATAARKRSLAVIPDGGVIDVDEIGRLVSAVNLLCGDGPRIVRVIFSKFLCGDRCSDCDGCHRDRKSPGPGLLRPYAPVRPHRS